MEMYFLSKNSQTLFFLLSHKNSTRRWLIFKENATLEAQTFNSNFNKLPCDFLKNTAFFVLHFCHYVIISRCGINKNIQSCRNNTAISIFPKGRFPAENSLNNTFLKIASWFAEFYELAETYHWLSADFITKNTKNDLQVGSLIYKIPPFSWKCMHIIVMGRTMFKVRCLIVRSQK